ncbi:MAG: CooT family nickel-binding protein [Desulfatitalea sp.]|nr:CooT family nickel-binding protein [Desulfatitalea sp.]NNK02709.1 CooT family nickel-binding protein [Desulfatitalea sp.]
MCEADVYLEENGSEALVLESVDIIEPQGNNTFRMVTIFGEQKVIQGRLKGMNLVDHRIVFTAVNE